MKTILVLTDFSINADYVAHYALKLAQKIEANLLLCNIYEVPADEKNIDHKAWPMPASEQNSINDLSELAMRLKSELDKEEGDTKFKPDIEQCSEEGLVGNKLNALAANHEVLLAVISIHSANNLTNFLGTNHTWNIIENAAFPVMVIPYQVRFKDYKLIAFASAVNYSDINVLESLSGLAKYSDSEIMLTHISDERSNDRIEESMLKQFFNQIPSKINYPKIIYHNIKSDNVTVSLKWLTAHTDIDLLVLVHQKRSLFQKVFNRSVTQKLTEHPGKPLLIFPCSAVDETLTVF
ncbi:universal stress protein [Mucilaginibacter sp. E4BP6]|uniref:universal stress protein n=1 Tax=Mucilaginibacter sp. E4BP6 TaxID=2723089 RepID=UPI0015C80B35|nr:universal stress protein [Mucilaginibacter sp. E4BP6]NYE68186.1 nucleotide-binding universal stress UspA family protein [Mucilaginibacter sp. E4BP6]